MLMFTHFFEFVWGKFFYVSPLLGGGSCEFSPGYTEIFTPDYLTTNEKFYIMQTEGFVSEKTRAIFLEFTIYNFNLGLQLERLKAGWSRGRLLGRKIIGYVICSFWDCWDLFYSKFIISTVLDIYPFHDLFACNVDTV